MLRSYLRFYKRTLNGTKIQILTYHGRRIKFTGLGKEILLNEVLGHFHQFFTQRHSTRIGWSNNTSHETRKLKEKDPELFTIIDGISHESKVGNDEEQYSPPPDWIESRSILKASVCHHDQYMI